ncbi:MAG: CoA transferase [Firmicutes bacterium]|nr:CoA transferase [Bacillota bacterium]
MKGPMEGIRVLDLSRVLAGPYCSMLLGDMGAEIIKVEEPGKGDDTRAFGPPFIKPVEPGNYSTDYHGESAYFLSINRNKKSIALNLKSQQAVEIIYKLAETSDVFIENFRPGTAEKLGVGYEKIKSINPRIVYASVSGFGQTGPESLRPGYDLVIQGLSGIMDITGDPAGSPYKVGVSIGDLIAGMYAFQGVLLALYAREKTGRGQKVDVGMLDGLSSLLTFQAGIYFATEKSPHRKGNQHPTICPYETFKAKDGYFNLAVGNDRIWESFCKIMKLEDLCSDEKFATNPSRVKNRDELFKVIQPVFEEKTVDEWVKIFDEAGIPAGPILSVDKVVSHPQIKAREMVVELDHPLIGKTKFMGVPVKLSDTPGKVTMPPPLLGEHTNGILQELGFREEEIKSLKDGGVI